MTEWDDVLGLADERVPASDHDEVLVVTSSTQRIVVIEYVQDWFGGDDSREVLRLVVDGRDHGVLHRASAYALVSGSDRGGLGSGDYATLPGPTVAYEVLRLRCPEPGCHVRGDAISYDPDDPPRCSLHHVPLRMDD